MSTRIELRVGTLLSNEFGTYQVMEVKASKKYGIIDAFARPFHWKKNGDKIKISLGDELLHFDTEEITSMLAYESELPFEDIIIDYQGNDYKF